MSQTQPRIDTSLLKQMVSAIGKQEAALYLGIGYRTIFRYISGERSPKGGEAERIDKLIKDFVPTKSVTTKSKKTAPNNPVQVAPRLVGQKASKKERTRLKTAIKGAKKDERCVEQAEASPSGHSDATLDHQTLREVLSTVNGRGVFFATVGRSAQAAPLLSCLMKIANVHGDMPAVEAALRLGDIVGNTKRVKVDPDVNAFYVADHLGLRFGFKHTVGFEGKAAGTIITVMPRFLDGFSLLAPTQVVELEGHVTPDEALVERLDTEYKAIIDQEYARYLGLLSSLRTLNNLFLILDSLRTVLFEAQSKGTLTEQGRANLDRLITRVRDVIARQKK